MKIQKFLALLLALILVFTLSACGNGNNDSPSEAQKGTNAPPSGEDDTSSADNQSGTSTPSDVGTIDIGSILSGSGSSDVIYGQLDEAGKQQIISDLAKEGIEASFGADGSMTVVDTDGTTMMQKPDGTWVIKDADGGEGQLGGNWPDNEFTKLVPVPDFDILAASADGDSFSVAFSSATIEQVRAYAAKVRAAGFNINEEVEDQEMMGMTIFSFTAENADGYTVAITYAAGSNAMVISK